MIGLSASTPPTTRAAVFAAEGEIDSQIPWHYGNPHAEQRWLSVPDGATAVDLSNRGVVTVTGPDRLSWLNDLVSHKVDQLPTGESRLALILDPHGHVEHELHLVDDGDTTWITVEPGSAPALVTYLDSMRFMRRVEVADVSAAIAVVWVTTREPLAGNLSWLPPAEFAGTGTTPSGADRGGAADRYVPQRPGALVGSEVLVAREELVDYLASFDQLAGSWALEALRVAAGIPRMGFETDHRALPHELGWIGPGVHLAKGCYRGQETVARVHNLGRPPRRMVLLHLDGSAEELPSHGDEVLVGERVIGWIGTPARHFELGPIATAIIKRNIPTDAGFVVRCADGSLVAAAAEDVVAAG